MTNIILCGGSGTRLWPISRTLMPKQFVKLFSNKSLFQLTVERNSKLCEHQIIVSNIEQFFLAVDQLEELNNSKLNNTTFLLEPIGKNTAPAIALACFSINPDEIVFVTPSDHLIKDTKAYFDAVRKAKSLAEEDNLVTFGIKPECPETGFGYIECRIEDLGGSSIGLDVVRFHEKPDLKTAKNYLKNNSTLNPTPSTLFFWNSGMFCFKAGRFLEELQTHAPDIYTASKQAFNRAKKEENRVIRIKENDMQAIPEESIDYAVMEKSKNVKVVPSDIGWSDLGSFDSLYESLPTDENGNTINNNHICIDSKNNFIYGNDRKIATIDIEDMIIVDTRDAILIAKKGSSQKVKKVVKKLKETNSNLHHIHLTAHRPWGTYTVLEDAPGYKIKRIEVKPGKRLSLQKHFHRNEHWIVVSGTATVTVGDKKYLVRPNESTYIKMGEIHRLENEGKIPVILIEAQVGEYTGEDDIIRIEDDFKRD